jgi:hypothetical protein
MKPWHVVLASVAALILFVAASVVLLSLLGTGRPWILALLVFLDVAALYVLFVVADRMLARCADDDPQVAPAAEVPRTPVCAQPYNANVRASVTLKQLRRELEKPKSKRCKPTSRV